MMSLLLITFSINAFAGINFSAYKGVEEKIDKDYQHLNPMWGKLAKPMIFNLRFYGDFSRGEKNDERFFIEDEFHDDAGKLIKHLFPSPAGFLATTTRAITNFANYVTNTKSIALLLKLADDVRNNVKYDPAKLKQEMLNSLSFPPDLPNKKLKDLKKNLGKNTIQPIIQAIEGAIRLEEKAGDYYKYFTETVILAFFNEKFNTQMDIWHLLGNLNKVFAKPIASDLPKEEDLLSIEDLYLIFDKFTPEQAIAENVYNILQGVDSFASITPYGSDDTNLISNETICAFIRTKNVIDPAHRFADCAETAIRHILNFLLFNSDKKSFEFNFAQEKLNRSPSLSYLKEFYELQPPQKANDSSQELRIAWNKVMADLNQPGDKTKIIYKQDIDNEIKAGFINMVWVLQKVFLIDVPDLPIEKTKWSDWLEDALLHVFKEINPKFNYEITYKIDELKPIDEDLFGIANVKVKKDDQDLFSFTINQMRGHATVTDIKTLDVKTLALRKDLFPKKEQAKKAEILKNLSSFQAGLAILADISTQTPLYEIFPKMLDNNEERKKWLSKVADKTISIKPVFLDHVLKAMSWDDQVTAVELSFFVLKALFKIAEFKDILLNRIEALHILEELSFNGISLIDFKNLRHVFFMNAKISFINSQVLPVNKLEILYIRGNNYPLTLSVKDFPKLQELVLASVKIANVLSLEDLPELVKIDLNDSDISSLTLKDLPELNALSLPNTHNLTDLSLEDLPKLTAIDLNNSDITNLALKDLPELKTLTLFRAPKLTDLPLKDFPKLTAIDLDHSGINKLILKDLPELKTLTLFGALKLIDLSLEDFPKLTKIDLTNSGISKLTLKELPELERLLLPSTSNLIDLSLKDFPKLTEIDLRGSNISNLVLKNLPKLENIIKGHAPNLKVVKEQSND
jgi:hypothetical protein